MKRRKAKKVLMLASVASMIGQFNLPNMQGKRIFLLLLCLRRQDLAVSQHALPLFTAEGKNRVLQTTGACRMQYCLSQKTCGGCQNTRGRRR